jgi:hypothetical protein
MNKEKLQNIKNLVDIQGLDGNWDYDLYMLGLFNGMEMILSILEDREPKFRSLKDNGGI